MPCRRSGASDRSGTFLNPPHFHTEDYLETSKFHLVYLEVVPAARRVDRLVHYELVEACGVLHLDGMGLGLGGVVRLLHVRPLGLLYGLLEGVGQGD